QNPIAVFSDSLLRPVVQKLLKAPPNFYVNCTPGGTAGHIQIELEASIVQPSCVYFVAGTNNSSSSDYVTLRQFQNLIYAAKQKFPRTPITVVSVPKRLDADVTWINKLWKEVACNESVGFLEVDLDYSNPNTWKLKDKVHLSLDSCGLPAFFD
uniref:SGNH hydrolase-type esterase domain-containing protein n=2 Tax=Clytia hemisphaerica TaxID=252671 RepID=A0A7M5WZM5_9CNID